MTELLEKVFEAAFKLPPEDQDRLAAALLEELASEERWVEAFSNSQEELAKLAKEALTEYTAGRTEPLG